MHAAGEGSARAPGYPEHAPDAKEGPGGAAGQRPLSASRVSGTVQDDLRNEEVPVQGGGRPNGVLAPREPPQKPQQEAGREDHAARVRGQGQVNDRHSQGVQAISEPKGRRRGLMDWGDLSNFSFSCGIRLNQRDDGVATVKVREWETSPI